MQNQQYKLKPVYLTINNKTMVFNPQNAEWKSQGEQT